MFATKLTKQRHYLLAGAACSNACWNAVICQRVPTGTDDVAMVQMYSNKVINKADL